MNVETCYRGIEPFVRLFATGGDGAQTFEFGSAVGSIVPASPKRSLFSTLVFDRADPEQLAEALPRFASAVDAAGVEASSVWIIEGDARAEEIAIANGFALDSTPRAMGAPMTAIDLDTDHGDVDHVWDMAMVGELNERAYELPTGQFSAVLGNFPETAGFHCFLAKADGRAVASVVTLLTAAGDCAVYFVATDTNHRRAGHARRAMTAALVHAREQGCSTTTLQATKHGAPLYALMGYEDLGVSANLWERRKA